MTPTPNRKLRVGVIGLGMGRGHIKGFQAHPGCEVVAVADTDHARLGRAREEFGINRAHTDATHLIEREELDIISVATPNKFHKPLTIAALERGAHVLCEKPMAMDAAEGREMIACAKRMDRRLMINFSYRFRAQSQSLKRLVEEGVLGDVYTARTVWLRRNGFPGFGGWFTDKAMAGGGPLIDLGVHRIDLALWLMGYPQPEWIMGTSSDALTVAESVRQGKPASVENHCTGLVRFTNGASLQVEASWACHRAENEFMETHLYGTKAGLVQKNVGGGYDFTAELYDRKAGGHYTAVLARPEERELSAMEHFAEAILKDLPTPAPAEDALKVQQIIDGIYRSAATGTPVKAG
jgi:predicted dehydrogenase